MGNLSYGESKGYLVFENRKQLSSEAPSSAGGSQSAGGADARRGKNAITLARTER